MTNIYLLIVKFLAIFHFVNKKWKTRVTKYTGCDKKPLWMLLPSAIQRKVRHLQYGKRNVEPY